MGMGYAGGYADVIQDGTIKNKCPKEFQAFLDAIEKSGLKFDEVAKESDYDEIEDKDVMKTYLALFHAFKKKTGLDLGLAYHSSSDDGDRYDDVDGAYWYVDGMYQLTKAGKKMKKYVERKNFVTFG